MKRWGGLSARPIENQRLLTRAARGASRDRKGAVASAVDGAYDRD